MKIGEMGVSITPATAFVDEEVRIRVTGASPGGRVRVSAWTMDDSSRRWESWAEFVARADGTIDLAEDASVA